MRFGPSADEFVEELYVPATYRTDHEPLVRDSDDRFPIEWLPTDDELEGDDMHACKLNRVVTNPVEGLQG